MLFAIIRLVKIEIRISKFETIPNDQNLNDRNIKYYFLMINKQSLIFWYLKIRI